MNIFCIEPLWGQGAEQLIGAAVFILLFIAQMIKAYFDARTVRGEEKRLKESDQELAELIEMEGQPKPHRERKPPSRKQVVSNETVSEKRERKVRKAFRRELAPQDESARFVAVPGTLDKSQLVAPTIEPTVKPTLKSMTGIYDESPTSYEIPPQPLTLDIQNLIARPEGVRQAIILAEILKRPEI
jgi:hypothetical protein